MEMSILRRQGKSLRTIAVDTGTSVNTVRKYLAAAAPPRYKLRPSKPGKLDPFKGYLVKRVVARQFAGLVLGLAGVWFVVRHKFSFAGDWLGLVPSILALIGISVGTLYQKRFCSSMDLRSGASLQFTACALLYLPLVVWLEGTPCAGLPNSS